MRIISQCGKFDIPYKRSMLSIEDTMIYACFKDSVWLMAEYSSHEKAQYVFKTLREKYGDRYGYYELPKDEDVEVEDD